MKTNYLLQNWNRLEENNEVLKAHSISHNSKWPSVEGPRAPIC